MGATFWDILRITQLPNSTFAMCVHNVGIVQIVTYAALLFYTSSFTDLSCDEFSPIRL